MGFLSTIMGIWGFGIGTCIGVVIGYFFFIYHLPTNVQDPEIRPLVERDSKSLRRLIAELPFWVKNPDYDRVDWINKLIANMWPYLDKGICKMVTTISKPIIAEQIPKYKIQSVDFQVLSLGSLPPTLQGMKVLMTDEKELIIEPLLKWAGNPNIIVAAKAFGLRAIIQLRNTSYKEFEKVLTIILGIMSAAIILAEATLLHSVDLSLISILIDSYLGMTMPLRYMKLYEAMDKRVKKKDEEKEEN